MLTIHLSSRFERSYHKMPLNIQADFGEKIRFFQNNPFDPRLHTHKLGGRLQDLYAFYLRDGFRVLLDFVEPNVVLLVNIGSHDDYRKWGC